MPFTLRERDYLRESDLSKEEFNELLDLAARLRSARNSESEIPQLAGKRIALLFEKPSTRTRVAFEVAAGEQGAQTTFLDAAATHISSRETIKDTARVLERLYDAIQYRGYEQKRLDELARYSCVPVWNGMTNEYHPTQMLADALTIRDHSGVSFSEIAIAYIGNGHNNIANSILMVGALLGMDVRIVCPRQLAPDDTVTEEAGRIGSRSNARVHITSDIDEGLRGAEFVYTDSWLSIHESRDGWRRRLELLRPYRLSAELLQRTRISDTRVLHCLPAYYSTENPVVSEINKKYGDFALEITEEVFESDRCIAFDQAENRMHTIKALMVATLAS
jgi:ornithine carbamoyltransferase